MGRSVVLVSAILALLTGACGGSSTTPGGSDPGGATAGPGATSGGGIGGSLEADLEAAAEAMFAAFKADDDSAYFAFLSAACRDQAGFGTVSERNNSRHGAINLANIDLGAIEVGNVAIDTLGESSARVSLTLTGTEGNRFLEEDPHLWIFEDGGWHWDDCAPFEAGGGGGGGVGGSGPSDPIAVGMVPTIADWYVYSTYVNPNANEFLASEGAPAPPAGTVYYLHYLQVTYNRGASSVQLADDLAFRMVAGSTTFDGLNGCASHVGAMDMTLVAAPGEGQQGDLCQAVPAGDVGSVFVVVTEKATGTDFWFGGQ